MTGSFISPHLIQSALRIHQNWFIRRYKNRHQTLERDVETREQLLSLAADELVAYRSVMDLDPLLPEAIWPTNYRGKEVLKVHRTWCRNVQSRLRAI